MRRHLTGNDYHGDAVHVRSSDPRDGIGHSWTRGHECYTNITRCTRIPVGGMNSCLLMPYQNVQNRILFVEGVVNVQYSSARVTPDVLDTLCLQRFNQNFCAAKLLMWSKWNCF